MSKWLRPRVFTKPSTLAHYLTGLLALGIGWNFLFVGATTLLTTTYTFDEKAKARALNDFMVFGTITLTSFSAGAIQQAFGWELLNIGALPFLLVVALAILWIRRTPMALDPTTISAQTNNRKG